MDLINNKKKFSFENYLEYKNFLDEKIKIEKDFMEKKKKKIDLDLKIWQSKCNSYDF